MIKNKIYHGAYATHLRFYNSILKWVRKKKDIWDKYNYHFPSTDVILAELIYDIEETIEFNKREREKERERERAKKEKRRNNE